MQRRATEMIPALKNLSYEERQLPTLVYRRLRGDMTEAYKPTSGKYSVIVTRLQLDVAGPATR